MQSHYPDLKSLNWLPVKERIIFKILLFVYHIINGTVPDYNKSLLRLYQHTRTLRSSNSGLLQIPLSNKFWGERDFAHAGPLNFYSYELFVPRACARDHSARRSNSH